MKKFILFILLIGAAVIAQEDGEITGWKVTLTVGADLKVVEDVQIEKKLLSYQSLDMDGDPRILFYSPKQDLNVPQARTTRKDGKIFDSTPNAFNLSTPEPLVVHPGATGWQEMVVTFLGLEPGSTTTLHYTITDKEAFRPWFAYRFSPACNYPVKQAVVTVRFPASLALNAQVMNGRAEEKRMADGDWVERTFTFTNTPSFRSRTLQEAEARLPSLYLSGLPSVQSVAAELDKLEKALARPDEAIQKQAAKLLEKPLSELEKIKALHGFIRDNFAEAEWPLKESFFGIRKASDTFASGQGTSLELALLLKALLDSAGVKSRLILSGETPLPEKALSPAAFHKAYVFVPSLDTALDPAGKTGNSLYGKTILEAGGSAVDTIPSRQALTLNGKLKFGEGTFEGEASLSFKGRLNPYRPNLESEEALKEAAKAAIPLPGLDVKSLRVLILSPSETSLEVAFTFKPGKGDRVIRLLPGMKGFFPDMDTRIATSDAPLPVPETDVMIQWTVDGNARALPAPMDFHSAQGGISVRTERGETPTVTARIHLGGITLAPDDYPAFWTAVSSWENPTASGLLLPEH